MPRGITENDVWIAADVLLLEGQRPTIERVRQKIGRGSPNTVSPFLETWFRHLGARIKDPKAFAAPADTPDPVMQAAKHLWEVAQAQTRLDFAERLQEGMAAAVANVEAAKDRAAQAEASAFEAAAKATRLQHELSEAMAALDSERLARAGLEGRLGEAGGQLQELRDRLARQEAHAVHVEETARRDVAAAIERSDGAQRRAAMEIEGERALRAKADKRSETLERRVDVLQSEAVQEQARSAERIAELTRDADRASQELTLASAQLVVARQRIDAQEQELAARTQQLAASAQQLEAATARADTATMLWEAFGSAAQTPRARNTKRRATQT